MTDGTIITLAISHPRGYCSQDQIEGVFIKGDPKIPTENDYKRMWYADMSWDDENEKGEMMLCYARRHKEIESLMLVPTSTTRKEIIGMYSSTFEDYSDFFVVVNILKRNDDNTFKLNFEYYISGSDDEVVKTTRGHDYEEEIKSKIKEMVLQNTLNDFVDSLDIEKLKSLYNILNLEENSDSDSDSY